MDAKENVVVQMCACIQHQHVRLDKLWVDKIVSKSKKQ